MIAWRLDKAKRGQVEAFSGDGAQIAGGRWNRKGARAVYASDSLALAALERFVHTQEEGRRTALVAYKLEIPEALAVDRPPISELPPDWRAQPVPPSTQDFGTTWLRRSSAAVLLVPSVVVPPERNLVLNPAHTDFAKIKVLSREDFSFDPRLWK